MAYAEEYYYDADKFSTIGALNGSPFNLSEKPAFLAQESGITTGTLNREVAVNNFWNLAAVEVDFVIRTDAVPSEYESGFAYNPEGTPETGHIVSVEYEVVNSYDTGEYLPEERMYREITGASQAQELNENGLIIGSGKDFTSMYITDNPDCYLPITIQPDNTGAFVITLDSGVADYLSGRSGYDSRIDKFENNMLFDFGVSTIDEDGNEFNNVDYYLFNRTGYIVPKSGFRFTIEGCRTKGIYYTYPFEESANTNPVVAAIAPPKNYHTKNMGKKPTPAICIGEPRVPRNDHRNSVIYVKNEDGTYVPTNDNDSNTSFEANVPVNYKSFPKNKTNTTRGTTPTKRRGMNLPNCGVRNLPRDTRKTTCGGGKFGNI